MSSAFESAPYFTALVHSSFSAIASNRPQPGQRQFQTLERQIFGCPVLKGSMAACTIAGRLAGPVRLKKQIMGPPQRDEPVGNDFPSVLQVDCVS